MYKTEMSADPVAVLVQAAKSGSDPAFERLLETVLEPGYRLACGTADPTNCQA